MSEPRMEEAADRRRARGAATRAAIMRSAEKLIAERGLEAVTVRDILDHAGQKNASALNYHFGDLSGLIAAIQSERAREIQARRGKLLAATLNGSPDPGLREICSLMVRPVFDLAAARVEFRHYVRAFGHELALSESSALAKASRHGGGGTSGAELRRLLRRALPHLDESACERRLESAVRLCSAALYHHARQNSAFRGPEAELFINDLIDAVSGLLSAPESAETRKAARRARTERASKRMADA